MTKKRTRKKQSEKNALISSGTARDRIRRRRRRNRQRRILSTFLMITGVVATVVFAILLITTLLRRQREREAYAALNATVVTSVAPQTAASREAVTQEEAKEETPDPYAWDGRGAELSIDFPYLLEQNSDTVAWLHIPALDVSYPVMYSGDNEFYLDKDFEKNYAENGSVFKEQLNSREFTDPHTLLYAHNTVDGSMFGRLHEFGDVPGTLEKGQFFYLYLPDGSVNRYMISSYYSTSKDSNTYLIFDTEEGYDYYAEYITQNALMPIPCTYEHRPPIVTLSTCYGASGTSVRYVVHGVLAGKSTMNSGTQTQETD